MVVTRERLKLKKKNNINAKAQSSTGNNTFDNMILTRNRKRELEKIEKDSNLERKNNIKRKSLKIEEKRKSKSKNKKPKISKQKSNSNKLKKEQLIKPIENLSDNDSNNESEIIDIENVSGSENDSLKTYNFRKRKSILNEDFSEGDKEAEEELVVVEEENADSDFDIREDNEGKKGIKKRTNTRTKTKADNKRRKISKKKIEKEDEEEKINYIKNNDVKHNNKKDIENKDNISNDINVSETLIMEDNLSEESENDEEWEEIEISTKESDISSSDKLLNDKRSITISIDESKIKKEKKKGINKQDREFRKALHKAQFICFIISCQIWNSWCNSELLKNLALSILPDHLIYNNKTIKSGTVKQLTELIEDLCEWFIEFFGKKNINDVVKSNSSNINTKNSKNKNDNDSLGNNNLLKNDEKEKNYEVKNITILGLFFQRPHWIKHFSNSENLYIILFVLFARVAGFKCRFVASLYPIPLSFSKKKIITNEAIKLWCEIYCAKEKRWIVVNPLYPTTVYIKYREYKIKCTKPINYIISVSQDGFIKDKTKFYDEKYYLSTWKLRMEEETIISLINDVLNKNHKDDKLKEIIPEDEDPDKNVPFPTSIGSYINHPLFALEKHVKQYEILFSREPVLGYIRNEPIYPRNNVRPVSTEGHWVREGLQIKKGEKPMKFVKSKSYMIKQFRLDYLIKKNAALPKDFELGEEMVPLYGKWQTEEYKPKPVVNGIVPKSKYGNIDLFKPSMLPEGGVHLDYKGIAQVAKRLGVDYAEAVTGIDVAGHHWVPAISGIVVAKENAEKVLSRYQFFEKEKQRKIKERKEKRIYGNWRRLIKKLLTKEILIAKYGYGKKQESEEEEIENNEDTSINEDKI